MVIKTDYFPAPGETIVGGKFLMNAGGKGANQAVAASRLGGTVTFIGKTGNDIFGKQAVQQLSNEGINIDYMATDPVKPSGVALITVDRHGENSIVVASGSNGTLLPEDIKPAMQEFEESEIVLLQLEIPMETVIITMGSSGSFLFENGKAEMIETNKVKAIDTTAAGDTFNGALAVAISEGKSIQESVVFANAAATISVTRAGAQASVPFRKEIKN